MEYETSFTTVAGGVEFSVSEALDLHLRGAYNRADGSFAPFSFVVTPEYNLQNRPNQSFDFSQAHLNSDLDTTRLEFEFGGTYTFSERLALTGAYRRVDLDDDAPYLVDLQGESDFFALALSLSF